MKTLIITTSKTGFSQRYAQWLAEAVQGSSVLLKEFHKEMADANTLLVYGGGLSAGKINGLDRFFTLSDELACKRIIFAVGATPSNATDTDKLRSENLTGDHMDLPFFYLPGGLNYEKMSTGARLMMKMFKMMMKSKKDKTPQEEAMTEAIQKSYDLSDPQALLPLTEKIKQLQPQSK